MRYASIGPTTRYIGQLAVTSNISVCALHARSRAWERKGFRRETLAKFILHSHRAGIDVDGERYVDLIVDICLPVKY